MGYYTHKMKQHIGFAFDQYEDFLPGMTKEEALAKIVRYEKTKDYNHEIMDVASQFLANSIPCVIVTHSHAYTKPYYVVPYDHRYIDDLREVHVLLNHQHYDALIPASAARMLVKCSDVEFPSIRMELDFKHTSSYTHLANDDKDSDVLTDYLDHSDKSSSESDDSPSKRSKHGENSMTCADADSTAGNGLAMLAEIACNALCDYEKNITADICAVTTGQSKAAVVNKSSVRITRQ